MYRTDTGRSRWALHRPTEGCIPIRRALALRRALDDLRMETGSGPLGCLCPALHRRCSWARNRWLRGREARGAEGVAEAAGLLRRRRGEGGGRRRRREGRLLRLLLHHHRLLLREHLLLLEHELLLLRLRRVMGAPSERIAQIRVVRGRARQG